MINMAFVYFLLITQTFINRTQENPSKACYGVNAKQLKLMELMFRFFKTFLLLPELNLIINPNTGKNY